MIDISLIVPTYNPGKYLFECLESICKQTFPSNRWEIILILNGNVDQYKTTIKQYLKEFIEPHFNITFITTKIASVSNARNIGIEKAKGTYFCFIDDDDIISPTYLEKLFYLANETNLVISNVYSFINTPIEKRENFFICKQLRNINKIRYKSFFHYRSFLAFPVAKIIHKNIVGNRRFDIRFKNGEDALFITSISDRITNIIFTDEDAIYYVRERIGSASRKKISKIKLLIDSIRLIGAYLYVYINNPFKYSLPLFLSRIPGVIKNAYILSKNK